MIPTIISAVVVPHSNNRPDLCLLTTNLPNPRCAAGNLVLSFVTEPGNGLEYIKIHFGIDAKHA